MKFARRVHSSQSGFSLIELMVSLLLMSIVVAVAVQQIGTVQQRSTTEQGKLDMFQEGREFLDQIVRDLHETGYPSVKQFSAPTANSVAYGIIKIAPGELKLEGDVDGSGQVSVVDYTYQASGNNCPCLQRTQTLKSLTPGSGSVIVQGVQNAATTSDPIFVAYKVDGTLVNSADSGGTLSDQQTLASLKTVQVTLKLKSEIIDSQTKQYPETSLGSTVTIVNCSYVANGQANSCQ
jgi:prepilin-type N-terminal cleavage/methylation domain-containing protein